MTAAAKCSRFDPQMVYGGMSERSISIDTIGATIDYGYELGAHCLNADCRHWVRLDLEALAAKLGRDHPTSREALMPRLRCSKCGGKNIGLTLSYAKAPKLR